MKIALASDTIRYSGFIFNRIVRILPLYLALALLVGTVINHGTLNVFDVVTLPLMVFGSSLLSKSPLTGAAWTIGVEFSFYLLFPFLAQATIRRGWLFLAQLILFIVLLRTVLFLHHSGASNPFYASLVGRFDQFLIGMLAAYGLNHSQALRRIFGSIFTYGASWLLLYLLLFFQARLASIALAQLPNPALAIFWPVLEGLVFAMMIASYTTTKWTPPHIAANSMKYLGKISYSFYLLHVMVLASALVLFGAPSWTGSIVFDSLVHGALLFGITALVAALSYSVIERPFLELRTQYVSPSSEPLASPARARLKTLPRQLNLNLRKKTPKRSAETRLREEIPNEAPRGRGSK